MSALDNILEKAMDGESSSSSPGNIFEPQLVEEKPPASAPAPGAHSPVMLFPPDVGARAWLTVVGGFCAMFCSFGYINVVGVFLEYYSTHQLKDYSSSAVSWITSVQTFVMVLGGIVFGRVNDMYGPRPLTIFGVTFLILGVMTTSVSRTYYQFMLAQGICSPIGGSALFYCSMSTVASWFVKRRSAALGLAVGGSSTGGVIMPLVFRHVLNQSNFGWAVRANGFLLLFLGIVAILTLRPRIQPKGFYHFNFKKDYIDPFKSGSFCIICCGLFCMYWGLFVPFGYIPSQATAHGFSADMADNLVSIMNGSSFFGRVIIGMSADKIGPFNCSIAAIVMSGIFTLALWIPSSSHVAIIMYSVFYGFWSGASVSLMPAIIASVSPVHEIGTRMAALSFFQSFAALSGLPIAGALLTANNGSFYGMGIWAGVLLVAGGLFVLLARVMIFGPSIFKKT
ncbi:major facilitator superfamily domain-containing protein [Dipodascopsis tothii]|uniref:major facilitator superfamily domain-containing protein n=1 Tax=Dipodascopsis tothii TaxID=44089 RepID=UPI0034CEFF6F